MGVTDKDGNPVYKIPGITDKVGEGGHYLIYNKSTKKYTARPQKDGSFPVLSEGEEEFEQRIGGPALALRFGDELLSSASPVKTLPADQRFPDANSAKTGKELTDKLFKAQREEVFPWEMSGRDGFVYTEILLRESPAVIGVAIQEFERKMPDQDISQMTGEALIRWLYERGALKYVEGSEVKPTSSPQATNDSTKGGIDLNPANLNLQIKRDGNGVPLAVEFQDIPNINVNGFVPVIINITPVTNLPLLLGTNTNLHEQQLSSIQ